jgi:hypothetical protein
LAYGGAAVAIDGVVVIALFDPLCQFAVSAVGRALVLSKIEGILAGCAIKRGVLACVAIENIAGLTVVDLVAVGLTENAVEGPVDAVAVKAGCPVALAATSPPLVAGGAIGEIGDVGNEALGAGCESAELAVEPDATGAALLRAVEVEAVVACEALIVVAGEALTVPVAAKGAP